MYIGRTLETKEVALIIVFTALYLYFSFIPAFPIVGLPSRAITLAAITAPIIGIILGPYLGMLSTILGGAMAWFFSSSFSLPSLVSGVAAAVFAGMLYRNRRSLCVFMYLSLLFFFGFYPIVGPAWLYPPFMWFQVFVFLILISPLQYKALEGIRDFDSNSKYLYGFFIVFLNSTMAGQIAGSLTYEIYAPFFLEEIVLSWQILVWVYPIERTLITFGSTLIGAFLHRILINGNLISLPVWSEMKKDAQRVPRH